MMPPYIFRCASVIHTAWTSALWGLLTFVYCSSWAAVPTMPVVSVLEGGKSSAFHTQLYDRYEWNHPDTHSTLTLDRSESVWPDERVKVQTQHRFPSSTLQTIACRLIYEVYCVAVIWRSPRTFLFNTNRKRLSVFHHLAAIKKWL